MQKCYVEQFTNIINAESSDSFSEKSAYSFEEMNQRRIDEEYKFFDNKREEVQVKVEEMEKSENPESMENDNTLLMTAVKIEKFKFENFSSLSKDHFLKFIQPGVINPDGSFSKIKG